MTDVRRLLSVDFVLVAGLVLALASCSSEDTAGRVLPSDATSSITPSTSAAAAATVYDLAATNNGWFRLTENDGCRSCTVVWRREGDRGTWQRLAEISGREAYGGRITTDFGPLSTLVVTPDGLHGWAWYKTLWSTHDGGDSWARVTEGPGRATDTGHQVVLTENHAWSLREGELWRSSLERDAWTRIDVRGLKGAVELLALPDRVLVQAYGEGLSNPRLMGSTDGANWSEVALPCLGETRPHASGNTVFVACPGGAHPLVVYRSTGLGPWEELARVRSRHSTDVVALAEDRVLVLAGRTDSVLLTPRGAEVVDLGPRQPGIVFGAESRGDVAYLLTARGLLWSDDGGRTWAPPQD